MTPEQVRAALAGELPPATLVVGPGAAALVFQACTDHGWAFRWELDAAAAREVWAEAGMAPLRGLRIIALNLANASAQVQNMLLKVLEKPSADTRFILAAERRPLPTVLSRCRTLVLGQAQEVEQPDPKDVTAVGAAIKAARARRPGLLAQTARTWLPAHARLLSAWAAEAATGRWQVFDPDFAPGVSRDQALRLLAELARYPGARLGAVVALDRVFCQE